ncbi:hypothetical protein ICJ04_01960 [Stenotrophomonas sp. 169]|uniref:hypothetical protein n=1 Tax=Stenotrophomonas sp. 169 TaxID=2770322 RepID=UPI0016625D80|nr:hypothetical protein [Stenotrophomonas sp. 169]QNR97708.1 hypothetical protein ICJ04_01960 [Stenotrophomonas sp. 169]
MKINPTTLSLESKITEFDIWVTPSIVEIKSTRKFREEMKKVISALEIVSMKSLAPSNNVAEAVTFRMFECFDELASLGDEEKIIDLQKLQNAVAEVFYACASLVFLVTGKSDNNHKCQLPIYLRNKLNWQTIPKAKLLRGGAPSIGNEKIPRILDSKNIAGRVSNLYSLSYSARFVSIDVADSLRKSAISLTHSFINSLLNDEESASQLKEFIRYFLQCRSEGRDPSSILVPLALFQVRGSVSASGGHEPEEILREKMSEWGLRPRIDFNTTDVIVDDKLRVLPAAALESGHADSVESAGPNGETLRAKTRAYDFVIPFRNSCWHPRIFIQSQFYAGDSGSVSHKNVDQTSATRRSTSNFFENWQGAPTPLFVEYLDGAGYCASLNGDLKKLLSLNDTHDFFQIRSAAIRLRRVIQGIGFLTPLEVCHAIIQTDGGYAGLGELLRADGYRDKEICRGIEHAIEVGAVEARNENLGIASTFFAIAAKYYLLDQIAKKGKAFESASKCTGSILIPGFGPYFGVDIGEFLQELPQISDGPTTVETAVLVSDLAKSGEVMIR